MPVIARSNTTRGGPRHQGNSGLKEVELAANLERTTYTLAKLTAFAAMRANILNRNCFLLMAQQ